MVAFGAAVRALRHERDMTQEAVAEAGDLHWSYIGQIERGERNLSLTSILSIARGLSVPPGELFDRAYGSGVLTRRSTG